MGSKEQQEKEREGHMLEKGTEELVVFSGKSYVRLQSELWSINENIMEKWMKPLEEK